MPVQSIISKLDDTDNQVDEQFQGWLRQLLGQLEANNQRQLLSCEGSKHWCNNLLAGINLLSGDLLFLSDRDEQKQAVAFAKSETLLGQESRFVVVDLFSGLNPDVLCIAAGLVKCGGLLILLSPGSGHWYEVADQYGVWQNETASPKNAFIDYFFERIEAGTGACIQVRQGKDFPEIKPICKALLTEYIQGKTSDQIAILKSIENWLGVPGQRIALISANRGRGKSTCLGFMVKYMTEDLGLSVCVTAYSRQSAAMLLAKCDSTKFLAPDSLIINQTTADVLVIDEAAMLPFPMLGQLCRQFRRVLMATTTGGYEGTGQGFLLRFVARLPEEKMEWLQLHQPVRWADNDCLESWIDDTFLLKPFLSKSELTLSSEGFDSSRCHIEILEQHPDIIELKRLYRLMVSAHYRTRPSDFRALVENPDLIPIVANYNSEILGVALLNREGASIQLFASRFFLAGAARKAICSRKC